MDRKRKERGGEGQREGDARGSGKGARGKEKGKGKGKEKEKLLRKLTETPEERRRRRAEKKARKEARRGGRGGGGEAGGGYSDAANPFGDANLSERFVWKLKREREGEREDSGGKGERARREELARELHKAKLRRNQREIEKERWEEERARLAREREGQSYEDWEKQEDQFYLEQARRRSEIRIREGRPKPIDMLYKNLNMGPDFDVEMNEPYKLFANLTLAELEELRRDIQMYLELDSHKDFWEALTVVCEDEIMQARAGETARSMQEGAKLRMLESGVHRSVSDDISNILQGKTYGELSVLHTQVLHKINSGNAVDSEYWEALLKRLIVQKAKARLREIHAQLLREKLALLQERQAGEGPLNNNSSSESRLETSTLRHINSGSSRIWSPQLITELDDGEEVVDAESDAQRLMVARRAVVDRARLKQETQPSEKVLTEAELYQMEAEKAMEENEESFTTEVPLEQKVYWWQDKYRPRRPRYFNRVHTGYEWNKYNQSHYDHDNPPPKIVQGYKFNIFYPDLIAKAKAPRYFIESVSENSDTCTIRFHAGPPYEDIAFKIVNREWEYSHKKGFKCVFERGVLHLWINFKRYRYRR